MRWGHPLRKLSDNAATQKKCESDHGDCQSECTLLVTVGFLEAPIEETPSKQRIKKRKRKTHFCRHKLSNAGTICLAKKEEPTGIPVNGVTFFCNCYLMEPKALQQNIVLSHVDVMLLYHDTVQHTLSSHLNLQAKSPRNNARFGPRTLSLTPVP